jgi:hypothetical protein
VGQGEEVLRAEFELNREAATGAKQENFALDFAAFASSR